MSRNPSTPADIDAVKNLVTKAIVFMRRHEPKETMALQTVVDALTPKQNACVDLSRHLIQLILFLHRSDVLPFLPPPEAEDATNLVPPPTLRPSYTISPRWYDAVVHAVGLKDAERHLASQGISTEALRKLTVSDEFKDANTPSHPDRSQRFTLWKKQPEPPTPPSLTPEETEELKAERRRISEKYRKSASTNDSHRNPFLQRSSSSQEVLRDFDPVLKEAQDKNEEVDTLSLAVVEQVGTPFALVRALVLTREFIFSESSNPTEESDEKTTTNIARKQWMEAWVRWHHALIASLHLVHTFRIRKIRRYLLEHRESVAEDSRAPLEDILQYAKYRRLAASTGCALPAPLWITRGIVSVMNRLVVGDEENSEGDESIREEREEEDDGIGTGVRGAAETEREMSVMSVRAPAAVIKAVAKAAFQNKGQASFLAQLLHNLDPIVPSSSHARHGYLARVRASPERIPIILEMARDVILGQSRIVPTLSPQIAKNVRVFLQGLMQGTKSSTLWAPLGCLGAREVMESCVIPVLTGIDNPSTQFQCLQVSTALSLASVALDPHIPGGSPGIPGSRGPWEFEGGGGQDLLEKAILWCCAAATGKVTPPGTELTPAIPMEGKRVSQLVARSPDGSLYATTRGGNLAIRDGWGGGEVLYAANLGAGIFGAFRLEFAKDRPIIVVTLEGFRRVSFDLETKLVHYPPAPPNLLPEILETLDRAVRAGIRWVENELGGGWREIRSTYLKLDWTLAERIRPLCLSIGKAEGFAMLRVKTTLEAKPLGFELHFETSENHPSGGSVGGATQKTVAEGKRRVHAWVGSVEPFGQAEGAGVTVGMRVVACNNRPITNAETAFSRLPVTLTIEPPLLPGWRELLDYIVSKVPAPIVAQGGILAMVGVMRSVMVYASIDEDHARRVSWSLGTFFKGISIAESTNQAITYALDEPGDTQWDEDETWYPSRIQYLSVSAKTGIPLDYVVNFPEYDEKGVTHKVPHTSTVPRLRCLPVLANLLILGQLGKWQNSNGSRVAALALAAAMARPGVHPGHCLGHVTQHILPLLLARHILAHPASRFEPSADASVNIRGMLWKLVEANGVEGSNIGVIFASLLTLVQMGSRSLGTLNLLPASLDSTLIPRDSLGTEISEIIRDAVGISKKIAKGSSAAVVWGIAAVGYMAQKRGKVRIADACALLLPRAVAELPRGLETHVTHQLASEINKLSSQMSGREKSRLCSQEDTPEGLLQQALSEAAKQFATVKSPGC